MRSAPYVLAVIAIVGLFAVACGGGSGDDGSSDVTAWSPDSTEVYVEDSAVAGDITADTRSNAFHVTFFNA